MSFFWKRNYAKHEHCEYCGRRLTAEQIARSQKFCGNSCYAESIRRIRVTKEELEHWYFDLGMTSLQIAEQLGCHDRHVREIMAQMGIQLRNKSEAALDYPCYPFSGDLVEKAYLIGFRLGDLNVRKDLETSQRLSVRCGTTVPAQVELIRSLFEPYGHVNLRQGSIGETQVECRLDLSFSFLLPKIDRIPRWVEKDETYFWAFAAGYTDAEGYIALDDSVIEISSCDVGILRGLYKHLNKCGVTCSLRFKWKTITGKDFYCIGIFKKAAVDAFFTGIEPYLRHADKRERMMRAWDVARS